MNPRQPLPSSELRQVLAQSKSSFLMAGMFSLFINLLLLLPTIYMLQVYDRVLPANSESTLLMLTLIITFLFLIMGGLEWLRSQILIVISARLDQTLGSRVFEALFAQGTVSRGRTASAQPLVDLQQLRQFLTGPGLFAFFDAPWLPLYIAVMFLFHPWYGLIATFSALFLLGLAVWNEISTRTDLQQANSAAIEAQNQTQRNLRNTEAIEAMGMLPRLRARWQVRQTELLALQNRASAKSGLIMIMTKTYRVAIQTLILGVGAYLAIHREISMGMVIAGSILLGRALAPMDLMISTWRSFLAARESYGRLNKLLADVPVSAQPMPLPPPRGELRMEKVVVIPPGAQSPVLKGVNLTVEPGQLVAIVGPSAAGKSTLIRAMLGIHQPVSGSVRLDGAEIDQWERENLGRHIGYLPQDVELLDGSVCENIARFDEVDPELAVQAAQAVGIHEMILRLPQGYETVLSGQASQLSAGQQQRLGIARALYGNPQLIVLDEPNSNLDEAGDQALLSMLGELKQQKRTVVIVTHRSNVLTQVDLIALMVDGQVVRCGPPALMLAVMQAPAGAPRPIAASGATASSAPSS